MLNLALSWLTGSRSGKASMTKVSAAAVPDPDDCVDEAISALRLLKPDALELLIGAFPDLETRGHKAVELSIRKSGEQMSAEEKRAAEIRSSAFYSKECYALLTTEGREKPLIAFSATLSRASGSYSRKLSLNRCAESRKYCIKVGSSFSKFCKICEARKGKVFEADKLAYLPPDACEATERCGLSFQVMPRSLVGKI